MYHHIRRLGIAVVCILALVLVLTVLPGVLNPTPPSKEERERDKKWVASSPYWLDRQACRWLMLCGTHHVRWDGPALPNNSTDKDDELQRIDLRKRFRSERPNEHAWTSAKRQEGGEAMRNFQEIPDYVLKYAPLVHLYSSEHFWPTDIADFVKHMTPYGNDSLGQSGSLSLDSLGELEDDVFLTSKVNVETRPGWLHSYENEPSPFHNSTSDGQCQKSLTYPPVPLDRSTWWDVEKHRPVHQISDPRRVSYGYHTRRRREAPQVIPMHKPDLEGYSRAPAVLVMVDKGSGVLDAFWFYFYAYNLGQTVLNIRFGNHVGDWEHTMVRFENGVPRALFCSEHAGGKAYLWGALEKKRVKYKGETAERPVLYSAVGSHAMYADAGKHPYVLPFGMLKDVTDRGPLWDPSRNAYAYFYEHDADRADNDSTSLVPAASNPDARTSWFHFGGPWGDELYPLADRRQWRLFGQYHYITGPLGPKFKKLDRRKVCQTDRCTIVTSIKAGKKSAWYG